MSSDMPKTEDLFIAQGKPDFVLADVPPPEISETSLTAVFNPDHVLWRQVSGFIEVKQSYKDSPFPQDRTKTVKQVVAQAADYARLILCARPFQLYVLGLLIYGDNYCMAMFDRGGVILSKEKHLRHDLELFVRVIYRLTCDLSPVELGHDPTVALLPQQTYYQEPYPSFRVTMGAGDSHAWQTEGPPIWSSLSLVGRGTSTWLAFMDNTNYTPRQHVILKVTWRSEARMDESAIYSIIGNVEGVAQFDTGGDVMFPSRISGAANRITIEQLRRGMRTTRNSVLHRLSLYSVGRPLWHYHTDEELIIGFRAALQAHKRLAQKGILHRDISAGNILLAPPGQSVQAGFEGFLTDFDLASLHEKCEQIISEAVPTPTVSPQAARANTGTHVNSRPTVYPQMKQRPVTRCSLRGRVTVSPPKTAGPEMTGTAIFMAEELLNAIDAGVTISRDVHHDLESFALVLIYVIYRHTLVEQKQLGQDVADLRAEFHELFGGNSATDIIKRRRFLQATNLRHLLRSQSDDMWFMITACWEGVKAQNPINDMPVVHAQEYVKRRGRSYGFVGTKAIKYLTYDDLIEACNIVLGDGASE
ncbi:hypothetical protein AcV5_004012 [Taiwanofungus camphoratus]|nr:hypothetical protein AcV5_004012 [Antrodia cinnamomea]